jgi:ATP-dependent helicase/nuclease subunit B
VDLAMIEAGIDLQLPVYIGVAAAKYGALPAGVFYVRIRPDPVAIEDAAALDAAARKVRGRFALCGISLNDVTVLGALDKSGPEDSFIGDLYAQGGAVNKSAVLSAEEFDALIETAGAHIKRLSRDIADAKIGISPYRSGNKTACKICEYGDICKFSESFGTGAYRPVGKGAAQEEPV